MNAIIIPSTQRQPIRRTVNLQLTNIPLKFSGTGNLSDFLLIYWIDSTNSKYAQLLTRILFRSFYFTRLTKGKL